MDSKRRLPVFFTPGVNHTTVAEHAIGLMLCLSRRIPELVEHTRRGKWKRITGHELAGSVLGVIGLGRIGREVVKRARAFGLEVVAYGNYWDESFAQEHGVRRSATLEELYREADILTLHTALTDKTRGMIGEKAIAAMQRGVLIVNCARGELVDTSAMVEALRSGQVGGYAADVLDEEPPRPDHPLLGAPNCLVTPHVGSRTYESVQRQAGMACENLFRYLRGEEPLAQANED